MENEEVCIKIWTPQNLPQKYLNVLRLVEREGYDPWVTWIAHIPQKMLSDKVFSHFVTPPVNENNALNWLGSWSEKGAIFDNNVESFLEHPEGDGYFLFGGNL